MTVRAGFIGCVTSSEVALKSLLKVPGLDVCALVTLKRDDRIGDFADLTPICAREKIPVHFEQVKDKDLSREFLRSYQLDVIFCIGWSRLLDDEVLALTPLGVVGFHPAALPSNRGRHPIIWALALGLSETASTLFLMDEGADSGPILSQELVEILDTDNATSLYEKILEIAEQQVFKIGCEVVAGNLSPVKQDHSCANTWRRRNHEDGVIDFRMSAQSIHNLIRALAPPYPVAEFSFKESQIKVLSSSPVLEGIPANLEPGKVLKVLNSKVLVKTADSGAIWLLGVSHSGISVGDYL